MFNVGVPSQSKMITAGNQNGWNGMSDPRRGPSNSGFTPGMPPANKQSPTPTVPNKPRTGSGGGGMDPGVTNGTLLGTTGLGMGSQGMNSQMMTPIRRPPFSQAPIQPPTNAGPVPNNNNQWQPQNTVQSPTSQSMRTPPTFGVQPPTAEQVNDYLRSQGGTGREGNYWSDPNKWNELLRRGQELRPGSDGTWYANQFLSNAEELTGGPQQTAQAMWGSNPNQYQTGSGQMGGNFDQSGFLAQLLQAIFGNGGMRPTGQPQSMSNYFSGFSGNPNVMDISRFTGGANNNDPNMAIL